MSVVVRPQPAGQAWVAFEKSRVIRFRQNADGKDRQRHLGQTEQTRGDKISSGTSIRVEIR
jgi:hypothetical protein